MPAISAPNAAIIRRLGAAVDPVFVNIWPLTSYATAKVNQTVTFTDELAQLTVDNTSAQWTSVRRGQLVRIFDLSGNLVYEGGCRRPPGATTLYIAAIREGDTGTAQLIAPTIADNYDIIVYDAFVPWSWFSFIDPDTEGYFKRYDREFDVDYPQTQYPEPHSRIGQHRHIEVAAGATTADLNFTADPYDFKGDTLGVEWTVPTGMTISTGTSTDTSITVTADPGNYIIRCQASRTVVTEESDQSNGFRYVFVTDGPDGDNPAFSDVYRVIGITNDMQDRNGRSMTLVIQATDGDESTLLNYLYPGAFVLVKENPSYSADGWATSGAPSAGVIDQFAGYVRRYARVSIDAYGVQTWEIDVEGPLKYFYSLPMTPQTLIADDTPETWYEVHSDLMNIGFWLYTILFYHSEIARLHDLFFEDVTDLEAAAVNITAEDIGNALQELVQRCAGAVVTCASDGSLYAQRHPSYEDSTYRTNLPTVWTWADTDVVRLLSYRREPIMRVGQVQGAAIVTGTTTEPAAYIGRTGLYAQAMGIGRQEMIDFICEDQADCLARVGHEWQRLNRPIEQVDITAAGNRDVVNPAVLEWHKFDLASYAPLTPAAFGTGSRWIPLSVAREWQFTPTGIVKRINASFEPETQGKPAQAYTPPGVLVLTPYEPPIAAEDPDAPPPSAYDWCRLFDFTTDTEGWTATVGSYSAGVGWVHGDRSLYPQYYREIDIRYNWGLGSSYNLQKITLVWDLTNPGDADVLQVIDRVTGSGAVLLNTATLTNGTGVTTEHAAAGTVYDGVKVFIRVDQAATLYANLSGSMTLTSIKLEGNFNFAGQAPPFSAGDGTDCT